jgi:hypothetical protein
MAASTASFQAIWLRRLKSCAVPQPRAATLYKDSRAWQLMSESPARRDRSKHIDIRVHSLKEPGKNGVIRLSECYTARMNAGVLTTATCYRQLSRLCEQRRRSSPVLDPRANVTLAFTPSN